MLVWSIREELGRAADMPKAAAAAERARLGDVMKPTAGFNTMLMVSHDLHCHTNRRYKSRAE